MKKIIVFISLIALAGLTNADQFRIIYVNGEDELYVSNSEVMIITPDTLTVYTDSRGRLNLNLDKGTYKGRIYFQNRWWETEFIIDHRDVMKRIYLRE